MVAHESGQTSLRSLNKIIPTPALGVDDKSRLNARGVLSASLGRGDVERRLCGGRGGHGDQSIARNLTSSSKFQASPCTRHPARVYFWLCSAKQILFLFCFVLFSDPFGKLICFCILSINSKIIII